MDASQKKIMNRAGSFIAASCLALLLAGCGGSAPAAPDTGRTEAQKKEEMLQIQLLPPEGITAGDREASEALIRDRIRHISGEREYFLEEDEEGLTVWLDNSCVCGAPAIDFLRAFVIRPGTLHLSDKAAKETLAEAVLLDRGDIETAEVVTVLPETLPEKLLPVKSASGTYLKMTMTDAFVRSHREQFDTWDKSVILMQDTEMVLDGTTNIIIHYYVYVDEDGKVLYAASDQEDPAVMEHLAWFVSSPVLSAGWSAACIEAVDWLTPEDMGENAGQLQKRRGEITGTWCRLDLDPSDGTLTGDEKKTALRCIAARLDALGAPYALGQPPAGEDGGIRIAVGTDRMNLLIAELLGSCSSLAIRMGEGLGYSIEDAQLRIDEKDGAISGIWLDGADGQKNKISKVTDEGLREGSSRLYLLCGRDAVPVLSASLSTQAGDGRVLLTDSNYLSDGPVSVEERWFYDFLVLVSSDELPADFSMQWMITKDDGSYGTEDDFGIRPGE